MRDIRFRAWDKQDKRMFENINLFAAQANNEPVAWANAEHWSISVNHKRFEIMQYTGLKDKNGVEIYEGDVLTKRQPNYATENFTDLYGEVKFNEGSFVAFDDMMLSIFDSFTVVVIGNIYENPELLND